MNDSERQLVDLLLDGELPDAERMHLLKRLEQSPEAVAYLAERSLLQTDLRHSLKRRKLQQSALASLVPAQEGARVIQARRPRFQRVTWAAAGLAAAACVTLALQWAGWISFQRTSPPVATLIFADEAAWAGGRSLQEGQRLPAGALKLERGLAVVRFDGGASLLLRGRCEVRLESAGAAQLDSGTVVVRAPEEAAGFILRTPAREVVDLGTEFSAKVEPSGATEVRVLEGEIALHERAAHGKAGVVLGAGRAVRFARADATAAELASAPAERFDETLRIAGRRMRGETHAQESFDYPPGTHAPGELGGGTGWAGPWRLRTLADGGRTYSGTTQTMQITAGGHLETPAGKTFRVRPLAAPLEMARDGVTYVSLRFEEPPATERKETAQARGVSLGFRSSTAADAGHVSLRVNQILRPVIEAGAGQGFSSRTLLQPGQRLLLVAKILARRDGEDEVSLRVFAGDESPELVEPAEWDVTSRGLRLHAKLDLIALQSSGPAARRIEELRIGATWRSVVQEEFHPTKSP